MALSYWAKNVRPSVCLSVHLSHFETRDIFEFCITLNGFAVMRPELLEFFFLTHVYISINIKMACCRIVSIDENRRVELQHENSDKCLKAKVAYQQLKPVKERKEVFVKMVEVIAEDVSAEGTVNNVQRIVEEVSGDILSYCLEKVSNLPQGHFRMTNFLNQKCDNPVTSMLKAFVSDDRLEEAIDLLHDKDMVRRLM